MSAVILAGLVVVAALPPQEAPPAAPAPEAPRAPGYEHFVPAEAVAFVGIDHLDELLAGFRASAYGRLLDDEKAAPVKAAFESLLEAIAAESKTELGLDAVEFLSRIDGRVGICLGGEFAKGEDEGWGALAFESTQHAGELHERLGAMLAKLTESGQAIVKHEEIGGRGFTEIRPLDAADEGGFRLAQSGSTLAVGLAIGAAAAEGGEFVRFVQGLDGGGGDSLAMQPEFLASLAARSGGVKFFLDVGRMMRASMPVAEPGGEEPEEARRQRVIGIDRLGALAAHALVDARGYTVAAHLAWQPVGVAKVLDAVLAGGEHALVDLLPVDAVFAASLQLDLPAGIEAAEEFAKEMREGPLFGSPADEAGASGAQESDAFHPRRDLLDHLDGRGVIAMVPCEPEESLLGMGMQEGQPSVNVAMLLGARNGAALSASLDKLLRSQGLHAARRRSEFEGYQVYTLPFGMISLHYVVLDDLFVSSPSITLVQDVLRRRANGELTNLGKSEAFTQQKKALQGQAGLLIWSANSPELLESIGGALRGSAGGGESYYYEEGGEGDGYGEGEDDVYGADDGAGDGSGGDASAAPTLEARALALLEAINALDATLLKAYLPAGSIFAIRADQAGLTLESIMR